MENPKVNEQSNVEERWTYLSTKIREIVELVLDRNRNTGKIDDWYDNECKLVTEGKNKLYIKMHNEKFTRSTLEDYREATKRRKKRKYANRKLEALEHLRTKNKTKLFYGEINKNRKDFKPRLMVKLQTKMRHTTMMLTIMKTTILRNNHHRWKKYNRR